MAQASGALWALKAGYAWELRLDAQTGLLSLSEPPGTTHLASTLWPGLPLEFDFTFTMPKLSDNSHGSQEQDPTSSGQSIFVKSPHYYTYLDFTPIHNDTMIHWDSYHFADNRFIFTMHGTALVLVAKIGFVPDGIKSSVGGHTFMFDSVHFPERLGVFEMTVPKGLPWLKMKQMIPLEIDGQEKYLALFKYGAKGAFYCVFSILGPEGLSPCTMQPIADAFSCPEGLMSLKAANWALFLFELSGMKIHQLAVALMGALSGLIWVLLILGANTWKTYGDFFSGNLQIVERQDERVDELSKDEEESE